MSVQSQPNIGPYMWCSCETKRGRYRMFIYGAYNAMGLIGSEHNGICILDDVDMQVVADKIVCELSGYHGPSKSQVQSLRYLMSCTPEQFCEVINSSGRNRHVIHPETVPTKETA